MKKIIILILVQFYIFGCAGSPAGPASKEYLSDGSTGWKVSCLGTTSDCYKKAYKMCPKGIKKIRLNSGYAGPSLMGNSRGHNLFFKCENKQSNKDSKKQPKSTNHHKVVIIKGSKDTVISGNVLRGAKLYGSGNLIVNGNLQGIAELFGSGDLIVNGNLLSGAKLHGSGDLIVKGDVRGNILSRGSGDVNINNNFYGIITIRGSGDLTVRGSKKGVIK